MKMMHSMVSKTWQGNSTGEVEGRLHTKHLNQRSTFTNWMWKWNYLSFLFVLKFLGYTWIRNSFKHNLIIWNNRWKTFSADGINTHLKFDEPGLYNLFIYIKWKESKLDVIRPWILKQFMVYYVCQGKCA